MKKFRIDTVSLPSQTIELFARNGSQFVEITELGCIYFWSSVLFVEKPVLPSPPCIDGVFSYPVGYVYKLPRYETA